VETQWSIFGDSRGSTSGNFLMYITQNNNLPTIVLIVALIFFTSIFVAYRHRVTLLLTSLFSQRHLSQLQREGKVANRDLFLWVQGIIVIVQALFLYVIMQFLFPKIFNFFDPILLYFILIGAVLFDYFLKRIINYVNMYLFDTANDLPLYTLYKLFFNFSNSIVLMIIIPIALYTAYWKLILLYIPLFLLTFSVTAYRLFTINSIKLKLFHFFIYFCTLEILPYLAVLKLLIYFGK
jgi:hypothetical protein